MKAMIFKAHFLFFLLIPIVIISQIYLLAPDKKIGLIDVDNGTLYGFRFIRDKYPDTFQFVINSYKSWGTYSHQFYYMGILNYFFGTNFENYHIIAHVFKIIATIGIYPLFYFLSGSSLIAFLGAIFYSFSPSSVGSLYGISNGNDYPAIIALSFFLGIYLHSVKKNITSPKLLILMFIFFFGSLIISPERSIPIIVLVLLFEIIFLLKQFSKEKLMISIKRAGSLLSPIFIFLIFKPPSNAVGSVSTLLANTGNLLNAVRNGRGDYLLNPFISLSSTFLPDKYWNFIGIVQTDNFIEYMVRLLTVPMLTLFLPTLFIIAFLSKKPLRFISVAFSFTLIGGVFSFFSALSHQGILINQAVAGFYILGLASGFLIEYLENKSKLYFGLFFGPFIAFIFILTMWLTSGSMDTFKGIYRYLTIAAIFSSLFLGNIIALLHKRIFRKKMFFKLLSLLPFLLLIQIIRLNTGEIKDYYSRALTIGSGWEEQNKMRHKLAPYYENLSLANPRIIYVDIHSDAINTQYYSNTLYAGWDAWPMWLPSVNFQAGIIPYMAIDYSVLRGWVKERDGKRGIFYPGGFLSYGPTFYKPENFFAVRFIDKKPIDITDEIKRDLRLND